MNLRRRLLLLFSLTIVAAVAAVAWTVSLRTRKAFESADQERTAALVAQFRREFTRRGEEIGDKLDRIAASERVVRMGFDLSHGGEPGTYVNDAETLAREYELDFLEIVAPDGSIVSSAQWPARFGYKESLPFEVRTAAFLKREDLVDGTAAGLFAWRNTPGSEALIYLLGGEKLDRNFLTGVSNPSGTQAMLYRTTSGAFDPANFVATDVVVAGAEKYAGLIEQARASGSDATAIVYPTGAREESVNATAIPLKDEAGKVLSVLLVTNSRRELVRLLDQIRGIALGVGATGMLLGIIASLVITARLTKPIEELAAAAREVGHGNWDVQVDVKSRDEIGDLADAFNRMTAQLADQRSKLVQSERVAAWRELARRLAHELKNPLFPMQITVENMVRAREVAPQEFDEIFRESAGTLTAELANLKTIIQRFSDFSKMPQPQLQAVNVNELCRRVEALHRPALAGREQPVTLELQLGDVSEIAADPELLHRALSNLVLNALDAMPKGGCVTLRTSSDERKVRIEVSDTGTGLTPEECDRLFTPYYTTKQHGTGLGLAIVQSVVSDHKGSIMVKSAPGEGATFIIDLPRSEASTGARA
jgi:signal transduction histidine kinase